MNYLPSEGTPGHESDSGSAQEKSDADTEKHMLTEEQLRVVRHPLGRHARVLAVAGSGKTTTMAYRVERLIREQGIPASGILVVMFNRLARIQFKEKLARIGMDEHRQPPVHTFHSCAYKIIIDAVARGFLPAFTNNWIEDRAEQARYAVHRAIRNLEARKIAHPDSIDPEEALDAIALWKGALIPPERAGYYGIMKLPEVYAEFERLRTQAHALTFDDFVPLALGILEAEANVRQRWCNRVSAIIVDEYQDVNHGQQRLLEMLAGKKADVMVVGDEDQTIYEWRGARPSYILQEFERTFDNKPHDLYQLPHTFRFGPVIAQCAQNVIEHNMSRIEKPLIAHALGKGADIHLFKATSWQQTDPHLSLATQVKTLVRETKDPSKIIVLGRTYAQLNELEAVFLGQKIPYRVVGRKPFFERREIQVLLDYVRLAMRLEEPVARQTQNLLLSVANTPNRKLGRDALTKAMAAAHQRRESTKDALKFLADSPMSPLGKSQLTSVAHLLQYLEQIRAVLEKGDQPAGAFLDGLVKMLDYLKHFDDYYGQGEHSEERKQAVHTFCRFAAKSDMSIHALMQVVNKLDTTQGAPEEHQIVMTSVFRTKGLEYDYVIIPNCIEGFMPCLLGSDNRTYDKSGLVKEPVASARIESERRLFYVALTRARKAVYIGATSIPGPPQGRENPSLASCFLNEMALEPTREVMNALQACAAGKPGAEAVMLAALKKIQGLGNVAVNLATHYIKSLKGKRFQNLAQQIRNIITKNPKRTAPSPPANTSRQGRRRIKIQTPLMEEKPWWR